MALIRKLLVLGICLLVVLLAMDRLLAGVGDLGPRPVTTFLDQLVPWMNMEEWGPVTRQALWTAILLMPLVYWLACLVSMKRQPAAYTLATVEGEPIMISPAAVLKFARLQVEQHPAVVSSKVKVAPAGGQGVSVWAQVTVRPIDSLPAIRGQLEQAVRDGFVQVMGIAKVDRVTVVLDFDERDLAHRPGSKARAEPAPEVPVRGVMEREEAALAGPVGAVAATEVAATEVASGDEGDEDELPARVGDER